MAPDPPALPGPRLSLTHRGGHGHQQGPSQGPTAPGAAGPHPGAGPGVPAQSCPGQGRRLRGGTGTGAAPEAGPGAARCRGRGAATSAYLSVPVRGQRRPAVTPQPGGARLLTGVPPSPVPSAPPLAAATGPRPPPPGGAAPPGTVRPERGYGDRSVFSGTARPPPHPPQQPLFPLFLHPIPLIVLAPTPHPLHPIPSLLPAPHHFPSQHPFSHLILPLYSLFACPAPHPFPAPHHFGSQHPFSHPTLSQNTLFPFPCIPSLHPSLHSSPAPFLPTLLHPNLAPFTSIPSFPSTLCPLPSLGQGVPGLHSWIRGNLLPLASPDYSPMYNQTPNPWSPILAMPTGPRDRGPQRGHGGDTSSE